MDPDSGEFIRDAKTGLCILCRPGEPGELVAQIDARNPVRDFSGYADKRSTAKKVVSDVFKKGDACFRLVCRFLYIKYVVWRNFSLPLLVRFGLALTGIFTKPCARSLPSRCTNAIDISI